MVVWIAAGLMVVIGIIHSWPGERDILRPLIANKDWSIPNTPRAVANRLLRLAWHLATVALLGLAAALVGVPIEIAFAATCVSVVVMVFVLVPGFGIWPFFLAAGVLALSAGEAMPEWVLWMGVGIGVAVAVVAAGFHVAWATGSSRGVANVFPQDAATGTAKFRPGRLGTLAISGALLSYAALVVVEATRTGPSIVRWIVIAALVVLTLRVFGEGKYVGISKSVTSTRFAWADDRFWTPAAGLLALGAGAALTLG